MLLPFQGANARGGSHPGRCPGLCAVWAFSPPRDGHTRKWVHGFGQASVHIVPANGLKAQKPLAQGKRSDTLGNARPSRVYALKGQKHSYGLRCVILQRCIYAFALSGRRCTLVVHPGRCPGLCAGWAFNPPSPLMGIHGSGYINPGVHRDRQMPANGLKAQKPLAQGKRSDTLGNARPSRAYALKGQKHNHRQPVRQPRRTTTTHTHI